MNRRKLLVVAGLAGVAVVLVARWWAQPAPSVEQLLMQLIERAAEAGERRDMKALRGLLSDDYRDSAGRDREAMGQLIAFHFVRGGTISVYLIDKAVTLPEAASPSTARATVTLIVARQGKVQRLQDIVPEVARGLRFEIDFVKDGDWRVKAAVWETIRNVRQLLTRELLTRG